MNKSDVSSPILKTFSNNSFFSKFFDKRYTHQQNLLFNGTDNIISLFISLFLIYSFSLLDAAIWKVFLENSCSQISKLFSRPLAYRFTWRETPLQAFFKVFANLLGAHSRSNGIGWVLSDCLRFLEWNWKRQPY